MSVPALPDVAGGSQTPESFRQQQSFWNGWNDEVRRHGRGEVSLRQATIVRDWLRGLGGNDRDILEVGCGSGWFCPMLSEFGRVTGTDLSDEVLQSARERWPNVTFVPGDFLSLPFESSSFDTIVTLEVLSHVPDQPAFIRKIASLLKPGGTVMMATQNAPVLRDHCLIPPPAPGQLRRWVDRRELAALVEPHFIIEELFSVTPTAHKGLRRVLTSRKVNAMLRPVFGNLLRNTLEARDWGWTLMLKAKKRTGQS